MTSGFGLDHLPYGVVDGHCVVRYEDHVLDLSTVPGLPPVFDGPTLNRFLALGRPVWEDVRETVTRVLEAGHRRARRDRRAASCRSPSATTSTSTPRSSTPRTSGASSGPTVTRCRRRGARCRSATTAAPARSSSPAPTIVRPHGLRPSYGPTEELDFELELGLRHRPGQAPRQPDRGARRARPRLRLRARQRLERARHPALRVPPARPVPGQVVRDLDLGLGHAAGRARALPRARARAGPGARRATCARTATGRSTSRSRSSSTAR